MIYKLSDLFSWHFLPKNKFEISDKQYHCYLFTRKKMDSEEFSNSMDRIWKDTDLSVFRKLLDI